MDIQLGGADESLEQMSAEGYSDYYAEDLSRRVNAQTKGIFDSEEEHADGAEENTRTAKPSVDDGERQPAARTQKITQPLCELNPKREGENLVLQPSEATA